MSSDRVDLFMDEDGAYHFVAFIPGRRNGRVDAETLCGQSPVGMTRGAWFRVGDRRGGVHFQRACSKCRAGLTV